MNIVLYSYINQVSTKVLNLYLGSNRKAYKKKAPGIRGSLTKKPNNQNQILRRRARAREVTYLYFVRVFKGIEAFVNVYKVFVAVGL